MRSQLYPLLNVSFINVTGCYRMSIEDYPVLLFVYLQILPPVTSREILRRDLQQNVSLSHRNRNGKKLEQKSKNCEPPGVGPF